MILLICLMHLKTICNNSLVIIYFKYTQGRCVQRNQFHAVPHFDSTFPESFPPRYSQTRNIIKWVVVAFTQVLVLIAIN